MVPGGTERTIGDNMQVQIINPNGTVVLDGRIPNDAFQGLAKGTLWEIQYPLDKSPMPWQIKMRISVDGQRNARKAIPGQQVAPRQDDSSPNQKTQEKRQAPEA